MSEETVNDYDALSQVSREWWASLQELEKDGEVVHPRDRAALAELRRIDVADFGGTPMVDVGRALSIPAFRELIRRLRTAAQERKLSNRRLLLWLYGFDQKNPDLAPFAIAAATLARIRADRTGKRAERAETARHLGAPRKGGAGKEDRVFAETRFKRLIRTRDDWPDLMNQARRIAAILEREAPVGDLGASLMLWNADPGIVRDWAFQYYGQREFEPAEPHDEDAVMTNA